MRWRVPKRWELTDTEVIAHIRQLAGKSSQVRVVERAREDMVRLGLNKSGVCEAVCEYIDAGRPVDETITRKAAGHVGKHAYELYPEIDSADRYVKLGIDGGVLVLISVHERHA